MAATASPCQPTARVVAQALPRYWTTTSAVIITPPKMPRQNSSVMTSSGMRRVKYPARL